jgi:hypothetical protein
MLAGKKGSGSTFREPLSSIDSLERSVLAIDSRLVLHISRQSTGEDGSKSSMNAQLVLKKFSIFSILEFA